MVELNARGDIIAAVEIIIYIPVLVLTIILVLRHGLTRSAGWIFLATLSTPDRWRYNTYCIGGEPVEYHIADVVQHSWIIQRYTLSTSGNFRVFLDRDTLGKEMIMSRGLKEMGGLAIAALALSIQGSISTGVTTPRPHLPPGRIINIGVILFTVIHGLIFLVHIYCWTAVRTDGGLFPDILS